MELWIRLQNRYRLLKVEDIIVSEDDVCCDNEKGRLVLGTYKNEERALEVLNEIQNILNLKDMYKYDRELVLKSWENVDEEQVKIVRQQMSVYKMPEN